MRIKYLRENFRRDFFQFGGLLRRRSGGRPVGAAPGLWPDPVAPADDPGGLLRQRPGRRTAGAAPGLRPDPGAPADDPGGLQAGERRKLGGLFRWARFRGSLFSWAADGQQKQGATSTTGALSASTASRSQPEPQHQRRPHRRSNLTTNASESGQHRHQDRRRKLCRTAATACRKSAPKGFTRTVSSLYPVYLRSPL